jgi:hypothetical protein
MCCGYRPACPVLDTPPSLGAGWALWYARRDEHDEKRVSKKIPCSGRDFTSTRLKCLRLVPSEACGSQGAGPLSCSDWSSLGGNWAALKWQLRDEHDERSASKKIPCNVGFTFRHRRGSQGPTPSLPCFGYTSRWGAGWALSSAGVTNHDDEKHRRTNRSVHGGSLRP